jgi:pimeloyl-ACP methyl ester carboxylesterase
VPTFSAHDGTGLAYHVFGAGVPVICLPGGPMLDSAYLGDLGGLSAHRQLIIVDPRGTGQSAIPADAAFDPQATRAALAAFSAPVLVLAGELDLNTIPDVAAEFAGLFPNAELVVQPAAGHYPWLDDADQFVATTATFLG